MSEFVGLSELQEKLLEKRIIRIYGIIDWDMFNYASECIARLRVEGSPDIEIDITSNGGKAYCGLDLYDLFRLYTGKKKGIVIGSANSMAAVVLQSCDIRQCAQHAEIHIHNILTPPDFVSLDTIRDKEKFSRILSGFESQQGKIINIFKKRVRQTEAEIIVQLENDTPMDATEALTLGYIDEII